MVNKYVIFSLQLGYGTCFFVANRWSRRRGDATRLGDLETGTKTVGELTAVCGYDIYEILADFWRKPRLATFIWRNVKRMLLCC